MFAIPTQTGFMFPTHSSLLIMTIAQGRWEISKFSFGLVIECCSLGHFG